MNTKRNMIIIKNEIKTQKIRSCQYNKDSHKWDVTYTDGKIYSYAYPNVEWLKEPTVLNPAMYRISRLGKEFYDVEAIYEFYSQRNFEAYWHVCFRDGVERDYEKSELWIETSCLASAMSEDVFAYFTQIANLSDLRNEMGEKILPKRYEKIGFIGNDVVLARYIAPQYTDNGKRRECVPIFPFGCNKSQYKAVKNALENQISVIQGPPGTGKTQTILNIIANILLQGKTVEVVSNNNAAIDNVYEKLASPKYNLDFIAAMLGNSENKKSFIENQKAAYPDFSSWKMEENDTITLEEIREKSIQLGDVFEKQEELACLKQELAQLELEQKYFFEYVNESNVDLDSVRVNKKITADRLMELWQECQFFSETDKKISLLFKLKSFFIYGIADWDFYKRDIAEIITGYQGLFYKYKYNQLMARIEQIETYLQSLDENLLEDMCSQSMRILKDTLAEKYGGNDSRKIFTEEDLWKNSYDVLREYPVVLSTTFSSRNSLSNDVIYDYLIMDEASQVDIATGALALSCAKNAVIVGDTKQLPNVVKEETRKQADAIFDTYSIREGYRFRNSFLQSVLDIIPDVAQTLLREHYRCHPKIINFCNQKFYKGELVIMTEDKGEENVLVAMKTTVGNHAREHYSQRQIDVIKKEIIPRYVDNADETGIIAPYKDQVLALEKEFIDIDVSTVHKFQGREKDTIIISTVDDEITDFVDDPYLLNVAVSRAKKKLILVVSGNEQSPERNISDLIAYIQYNNFEVKDSTTYSIFDYLYKQYTVARQEYLQKHKKISEYESENLMYALILDILEEKAYTSLDVVCHFPLNMLIKDLALLNERECAYVMNPATHLDFVILNRISKKIVLAIEVDGYEYHKNGTVQAERDKLKDHILELYKIPFIRFKTNGSGEKEMIMEKLAGLVG